jgi:hypothetical protein
MKRTFGGLAALVIAWCTIVHPRMATANKLAPVLPRDADKATRLFQVSSMNASLAGAMSIWLGRAILPGSVTVVSERGPLSGRFERTMRLTVKAPQATRVAARIDVANDAEVAAGFGRATDVVSLSHRRAAKVDAGERTWRDQAALSVDRIAA